MTITKMMKNWPVLDENGGNGGEGGGGGDDQQQQTQQQTQTQTQAQQQQTQQQAQTQQQTQQQQTQAQQQQTQTPNLMDDDPDDAHEQPKPPTEDEIKAFREGIKAVDLGEGVTFDDAALDAMTGPLMELAGNDPKKAEGIVKAYTDYRRAEVAKAQEQRDAFITGLVNTAKERFGNDLKQIVALAKDGGKRIFGDEIWNQMKSVPEFANNPDIIEKLAAFGRSVKSDTGAAGVKTGTAGHTGDWRTNMYGQNK